MLRFGEDDMNIFNFLGLIDNEGGEGKQKKKSRNESKKHQYDGLKYLRRLIPHRLSPCSLYRKHRPYEAHYLIAPLIRAKTEMQPPTISLERQ